MTNLIYMFWLSLASLMVAGLISIISAAFNFHNGDLDRWLLASPVIGLIAAIPLKNACDLSTAYLQENTVDYS